MTLALWGLPEGPCLFLPVFGPSDPRDAVWASVSIQRWIHLTWVGQGAASRCLGLVALRDERGSTSASAILQ